MGDHALDAVNEALDMDALRMEFRSGKLSYCEAYDEGLVDELGYEAYSSQRDVVCRYCHKHLRWKLFPAGWRTAEANGNMHRCQKFKRTFENDSQ